MKNTSLDGPVSFHVLAKPAGPDCNLACEYCFFLSKELLYPGDGFRMTDAQLETYIRQMLVAQGDGDVEIAWQGGEPTLMGLDFFRRSVELVNLYRSPGQQIVYTIQTNGTLLNDSWARFFKEQGFLVGLSVDGPRELHDAYRRDRSGTGSFDSVMRGWEFLKARNVDVNILCALHAANAGQPLEVYRFFRDVLGARFLQFIPVVERINENDSLSGGPAGGVGRDQKRPLYVQTGNRVTNRSVGAGQFGRFLIEIFDEWLRLDVGEVFVQHFDAALANWYGEPPAVCVFSETCGRALALEHNGDLYSCDHYVEPGHFLGNINQTPMKELVTSGRQSKFGSVKRDSLPAFCLSCDVLFACRGECPRNRFIRTPGGEEGLNYLCVGYQAFFNHIDRPMRLMSGLLRQGRAPSEISALLVAEGNNSH
jgi:uncharacterized protein